jgi:hypothetical protein
MYWKNAIQQGISDILGPDKTRTIHALMGIEKETICSQSFA